MDNKVSILIAVVFSLAIFTTVFALGLGPTLADKGSEMDTKIEGISLDDATQGN
ncbi:hypothetical protein H0266_18285 [Halobacillus locisalis]|uniref:Uncharacterized protein n=1 Tax=Halobacillus locisalis TaxID=220753 RepID=A0A838CY20_9BACI|nr:hypothetical protein [Halobacillus locisalis]MBA2176831.1 hypothetical protein [Halobacillus locisalis]